MNAIQTTITTIGNLTIDDIVLYDTREMFLESIGGNAFFSAIGTRIWDASPRIVARIGRGFPMGFRGQAAEYGIETSLAVVDSNDIRDWALYEPGGARQFVNHLSSGTYYEMSITADELPVECLSADGIHLAPLHTDIQHTIVDSIIKTRKKNAIISWDPHEYFLSQPQFKHMAYEILEKIDLFLPSLEEVKALCGPRDIFECMREFAARGPRVVAVKMSTDGSLVYTREDDRFYSVPIFHSETKDPTGAGDSYCGGFLTSFIETGDAILAACCGTVAASYIVERIGALNKLKGNFSEKHTRLEIVKKGVRKI
jgi:sugar/nucleoside kinase (ribokinase family)